ncbi:saccharopine dehydrogenase family protein [Devosia psychrophila]|uniref:Carboxynorspermidine dehydrogenase n=1 Tax=Devosia psychrophila TaxID=728005 RepID=A0A0F5Q200_9HYPH|nr:saccharopine dehydrogenase family protein [Devosia psychrophila]KKC34084.1 saccharopine dehydrogenase [Devosia psychrophila]SFD30015.1 carboxynorspermidine dehydrogenase [Devosia psychrophila]
MKKNILIIGAGGVGHVVAHKLATAADSVGSLHIASRTIEKCNAIAESVAAKANVEARIVVQTHKLNAFDAAATIDLIRQTEASIVVNVGPSFINLAVLRACIETGAAYIDTAIHEDPQKVCEQPPWYANHEWPLRAECERRGITAILGAGFDPGVVNAYVALAAQDHLDALDSIDIIDVNAGSHGQYFATNFNAEINLREFTGDVWTWQEGRWVANAMFEISRIDDLPIVGRQKSYLTGHDEIHSLSAHFPHADIRFWMGFDEHYITVFEVLKNLGLLSEKPVVLADGTKVVPLQLVKHLLPDPASLAPMYQGKTFIGVLAKGTRDGKPHQVLLYNTCDHADCFTEISSQAIAYTAGVPAAAAALLVGHGDWDIGRMVNVEQLPPRPFLALTAQMGLPTSIVQAPLGNLFGRLHG